jgi:hypothetical protein
MHYILLKHFRIKKFNNLICKRECLQLLGWLGSVQPSTIPWHSHDNLTSNQILASAPYLLIPACTPPNPCMPLAPLPKPAHSLQDGGCVCDGLEHAVAVIEVVAVFVTHVTPKLSPSSFVCFSFRAVSLY